MAPSAVSAGWGSAVGGWQLVAVWRLAVGGGWRLVAVGGWSSSWKKKERLGFVGTALGAGPQGEQGLVHSPSLARGQEGMHDGVRRQTLFEVKRSKEVNFIFTGSQTNDYFSGAISLFSKFGGPVSDPGHPSGLYPPDVRTALGNGCGEGDGGCSCLIYFAVGNVAVGTVAEAHKKKAWGVSRTIPEMLGGVGVRRLGGSFARGATSLGQ